jgi:hypothetical protein
VGFTNQQITEEEDSTVTVRRKEKGAIPIPVSSPQLFTKRNTTTTGSDSTSSLPAPGLPSPLLNHSQTSLADKKGGGLAKP